MAGGVIFNGTAMIEVLYNSVSYFGTGVRAASALWLWALISSAYASEYHLSYSQSNQDWQESRKKLNADFTVQSFEFQKAVPEMTDNTRLIVNSQADGRQSVALSQSWELAEGIYLEHRAQMGIEPEVTDPARKNLWHFSDSGLEETLIQRHLSQLNLKPSSWSSVSLSNDFHFRKREQSLEESQRRSSAAKGKLQVSRDLKIEPYFTQTQERRYDDREMTRDTLGMNLDYKISRYTTLQPKFSAMTIEDDLGRASMEDRLNLGVQQALYKKYLTLNTTPEYMRQTRDWDRDYLLESYGLDNAVTWTPIRHLTFKNGSKLLQQDFLHNEESRWRQLVYSEISHQPVKNMMVKMRSEYDISERERQLDQFHDSTSKMNLSAEVSHRPVDEIALKVRGSYRQEVRESYSDETLESKSHLAFAFRPEYRISDTFTTGAEYRYQHRDHGNAASALPEEEQVFMVNIMGTF